jgi:hypothetical protein
VHNLRFPWQTIVARDQILHIRIRTIPRSSIDGDITPSNVPSLPHSSLDTGGWQRAWPPFSGLIHCLEEVYITSECCRLRL